MENFEAIEERLRVLEFQLRQLQEKVSAIAAGWSPHFRGAAEGSKEERDSDVCSGDDGEGVVYNPVCRP